MKRRAPILAALSMIIGAVGCGESSSGSLQMSTCGEWLDAEASTRRDEAAGMIVRLGDSAVSDNAGAFASQISEACRADRESDLAVIAAAISTTAKALDLEDFDKPVADPVASR